jgi:hypothetical protein
MPHGGLPDRPKNPVFALLLDGMRSMDVVTTEARTNSKAAISKQNQASYTEQ